MMQKKWCSILPTGWRSKLTACKPAVVLLALLACAAAACTRPLPTTPAASPAAIDPSLRIVSVRITQENGIFVSGESHLPAGACVQTMLLADGTPVDWWRSDVCIEPEAGAWEILVPLGRRGAPEQLSEGAQYELQAWWTEQKENTLAHFPFDLSGPQQP